MGIQPRTKDQAGTTQYPFVLFAAPPSGSEDYAAEVSFCGCSSVCAAICDVLFKSEYSL